MLTAILYIRVSTDEQTIKGYSQRSQASRLKQYCEVNKIRIIRSVYEDASAKTFERPQWQTIISDFKRDKECRPNLLLFTRWDRFSRNTADAYYMINRLKSWDIEPQTIEQLLDLSIPENKMLLAMYIVSSEVENDRRSLNVKHGMNRAWQEGHWIGKALLGFSYVTLNNGKRILGRKEPEALLVNKAFTAISEDCSNVSTIHRQIVKDGLACSKSNFWKMLKNPVYCGKIRLPAFNGNEPIIVQSKHSGIVTVELFHSVQEVLRKRSRGTYSKAGTSEFLPLRGLLHCPRCTRKLSGSGSLGYKLKYYYYHCQSSCGYRVRADKTHIFIQDGLDELEINKHYSGLFTKAMQKEFEKTTSLNRTNQAYITSTIEKLIERATRAKTSLQKGYLDHEDYVVIKADCKKRIHQLGQLLHQAYSSEILKTNQLAEELSNPSSIGRLYQRFEDKSKYALLNLIMKPSWILCTTSFSNNLSQTAQFIFGKKEDINKGLDFPKQNIMQQSRIPGKSFRKVLELHKTANDQITVHQTEKIVDFIRSLAVFLVKNYTLNNV